MENIPKQVIDELNEIRESGDHDFANLLETNVKYYLVHLNNFDSDPDELIEFISDILWSVNAGLNEEEDSGE